MSGENLDRPATLKDVREALAAASATALSISMYEAFSVIAALAERNAID